MPVFDPNDCAQWCGGVWQGIPPVSIGGFHQDSRDIPTDTVYVALRGERFDGHAFIGDAFGRGAVAALVERVPDMVSGPCLVIENTQQALADLAKGHLARCRSKRIGITGSVGKTTVKEMIADVLAQQGKTSRTWRNWNNDIGLPLSLLRMSPDDLYGVFEMGMNHPGELQPLCDLLKPQWGVITSIGPAHLENFSDVKGIAEEKATLANALPEDGLAFLSPDDPWYAVLREKCVARVVRCSLESADAEYVGQWKRTAEGSTLHVTERETGHDYTYTLTLPGRYMADNALRAIALGREAGVDPELIDQALRNYHPLDMRWRKQALAGLTFINDAYNANPISMRAAIDAFSEWEVPGGKWLVLAGMFELGSTEQEAHREVGRYVAGGSWRGVITIGPRGRWLAEGARDAGWSESAIWVCGSTEEAADMLLAHAQASDVVLLKASRGEKLERVIEDVAKRGRLR